MNEHAFLLETQRLRLELDSTEMILARIDAMPEEHRAQVSPAWLAQLRAAPPHPWTHSFTVSNRATGEVVGTCSFKGPPDDDGAVEVAYAIAPAHRGAGFAKDSAKALVDFACAQDAVRIVRAHTLPQEGPSPAVLRACGFQFMGDVIDPEDGPVWRWEIPARETR